MSNNSYHKRCRQFAKSLNEILANQDSILLTSWKADDDSMTSLMALHFILKHRFPEKNIRIIVRHFENKRYERFATYEDITFAPSLQDYMTHFDVIIFVDGSQYKYWNLDSEDRASREIVTVTLDHHSSPADHFSLSLIEPQASSCAEMIYFAYCEETAYVDSYLAKLLLTGIFGDTAALKYIDRSKSGVYAIADRLVRAHSIDIGKLVSEHRLFKESIIPLLQLYMRNLHIESSPNWPSCMVSWLSTADFNEKHFSSVDIEEAADFSINQIGTLFEKCAWSFFLYPFEDSMRVKLRSRTPRVNVRLIAESLGIGGGHNRASGGVFKNSCTSEPKHCLEILRSFLSESIYDASTDTIVSVPLVKSRELYIQSPT